MLASLKLWLLFFSCSFGSWVGLGECDFLRCGLILPTFIYILYILLSYSVFVLPNYLEIFSEKKYVTSCSRIYLSLRDDENQYLFCINWGERVIYIVYLFFCLIFFPGKIFFNYKPTKQTKQLFFFFPLKKFNPLIIFLLQKQQQLSTFL